MIHSGNALSVPRQAELLAIPKSSVYRLGVKYLMPSRQKGIKHLTFSFEAFKC
jgi:hypothetical protein